MPLTLDRSKATKAQGKLSELTLEIQDLTPGTIILLLEKLRQLHSDIVDVSTKLNITFYSCDSDDEARVLNYLNDGYFTYEVR